MKHFSIKLFTAVYAIILVVNFLWFISGSSALETESPLRIVLGSLLIFLLPGLVWGEILGFRSSHILETIALSFALTLTIEIILLPIPFLFGAKIWLWVALLFFICVLGIFFLNLKLKNGKEPEFINPLFTLFKQSAPLSVSTPLILVVLVLISYGTYRWGEDLITISGEKLLHMIFVRHYYSMPMVLNDLGLNQGVPPPNLIHLWEYLIAGWAFLINMDPLPLFYHARFVIPILGFSGMYLLIRNIFLNATKSEIIFWGVLIMCLGWFILLSPSSLDWVKRDPYRGVTAFMGTVHHADAAMDILVALIAGLSLLTLRRSCWKHVFLLAGILVASFMWHPREFFQSAIYVGIFGMTIYLSTNNGSRKMLLTKMTKVVAAFLIVPVIIFLVSHTLVEKKFHGRDELKIKKTALNYAIKKENILGVRNLFNFPLHFGIHTSGKKILSREESSDKFTKDWNYSLWLIFSALAILLLAIYGDKKERRLSLFFVALWFFVLAWNFSMLIIMCFAYSEIFTATPRMIYIFSYIIIADAIYLLSMLICGEKSRRIDMFLFFVLMFGLGLFFHWWWTIEMPYVKSLSTILSLMVLFSLVLLIFPKLIKARIRNAKRPVVICTVIGFLLLFLPILWKDYNRNIQAMIVDKRKSIEWFGNENPFGFSRDLIDYIRTLPPRQTVLVDPLGKACMFVYTPQYPVVVPKIIKTVISARKIYREVRKGKHPLFNLKNDSIDHKAIKDWLSNHAVDYILIEKKYYSKLLPYFRKFKKDFAITFNNQKKRELVVHYFGKDDQSL